MKGLFPSGIYWNIVGENVAEGRRQFNIPDTNMFFTSFILENLFEAQHLGAISIPTSVVKDGTDALLEFRDKNAGDGIPFYNFWVREKDTISGGYYIDQNNFNNIFKNYGTFSKFVAANQNYFKELNIYDQFLMISLGLENLKFLTSIRDVDDSCSCLTVGYYLNKQKSGYPQVVKNWNQQNSKKWEAIDFILNYSYRPFSKNLDQNSIAPMSYYVIHPFLQQWKSKYSNFPEKLESLTLITSWLYNISSQRSTFGFNQMPSNVNNVDLAVSANALLGILQTIRSNDTSVRPTIDLPNDLGNIFTSNSLLIKWALESRIIYDRPDLSFLYYTSVQTFHHFIARLVYFLEEYKNDYIIKGKQFPLVFDSTLEILKNTSEVIITREILNTSHGDCNDIYWESFLGNADTVNGSKIKYSEDRFFSTALAINSLIDIWTVPIRSDVKSIKRKWKENTPIDVKLIVDLSIEYLKKNILKDIVKSSGPFFTFSPNTPETIPLRYPSNFCVYFNSTKCDPHQILLEPWNVIATMSGFVSELEYKNMLSQQWSGVPVPMEFKGYNFYPIPYFSSDTYTYSITLLAFSKYLVLF
eukprot:gene6678-8262_t